MQDGDFGDFSLRSWRGHATDRTHQSPHLQPAEASSSCVSPLVTYSQGKDHTASSAQAHSPSSVAPATQGQPSPGPQACATLSDTPRRGSDGDREWGGIPGPGSGLLSGHGPEWLRGCHGCSRAPRMNAGMNGQISRRVCELSEEDVKSGGLSIREQ